MNVPHTDYSSQRKMFIYKIDCNSVCNSNSTEKYFWDYVLLINAKNPNFCEVFWSKKIKLKKWFKNKYHSTWPKAKSEKQITFKVDLLIQISFLLICSKHDIV